MLRVEPLRDDFERLPITVSVKNDASFTQVYGFVGRKGRVFLEGQLFKLKGSRSKTVLLFMHPSSALNLLPLPAALARSGVHVICGGSRYLRNDTALIMENVAVDMGAYVQHARENLGYEHVVLAGWSGGGSLSLFYQAQAESPTVRQTPAGESADMSAIKLQPADAILSVAAHLSRAETLSEWIDPSVVDEANPDRRDPALDLYDPDSPNKPPYDEAFLEHYRSMQLHRCRRITDYVLEELARLKSASTKEVERGFVVHRTMADPRWLDRSVDPNDRGPGCYLGDPETVNSGPVGLARFSTLRSWLSQWSPTHSNATTRKAAPSVSVPALVIENSADDATPASHPRLIHDALGSTDKTFRKVVGATHYYQNQPEKLQEAAELCRSWLNEKGFLEGE